MIIAFTAQGEAGIAAHVYVTHFKYVPYQTPSYLHLSLLVPRYTSLHQHYYLYRLPQGPDKTIMQVE